MKTKEELKRQIGLNLTLAEVLGYDLRDGLRAMFNRYGEAQMDRWMKGAGIEANQGALLYWWAVLGGDVEDYSSTGVPDEVAMFQVFSPLHMQPVPALESGWDIFRFDCRRGLTRWWTAKKPGDVELLENMMAAGIYDTEPGVVDAGVIDAVDEKLQDEWRARHARLFDLSE